MSNPEPSTRVAISGIGAVSAAGWGVEALVDAIRGSVEIPLDHLPRPGRNRGLAVRRVPPPPSPPPFMRHPRLRRASPISRFALAAALEALGEENLEASRAGSRRIGVVCSVINACVNYSNRFYGEVLHDPATASPILFPETVFNAPSSHISAFIGCMAPNDTLVSDSAGFVPALDLATLWLVSGEVDACLVIGAEEVDWLSAEGLALFLPNAVTSEGAGAFLVELAPPSSIKHHLELASLTDPVTYDRHAPPDAALRQVRRHLELDSDPQSLPDDLLVASACGFGRLDAAEAEAWSSWQRDAPRWRPLELLGHSLGAASALQCVAAAAAVRAGLAHSALVSAVGLTRQAAGLRVRRPLDARTP